MPTVRITSTSSKNVYATKKTRVGVSITTYYFRNIGPKTNTLSIASSSATSSRRFTLRTKEVLLKASHEEME